MTDGRGDDLTPLDLALGEGSDAARQEGVDRATADPRLREQYTDHLVLMARIRDLDAPPSPGFAARMRDAERQHHGRRAALANRRAIRWSVAAVAALAIAAVIPWLERRDDLGLPVALASVDAAPIMTFTAAAPDYVSELDLEKQVDRLAGLLAAALPHRLADAGTRPEEVADMVSALAASGLARNGGAFGPDLQVASEWLVQRLPGLHGGQLAVALEALSMAAAETGSQVEAVQEHCRRLVSESLADDGSAATHILSPTTPASQLGDCGRLLAMAPAFGVDAAQAARLRHRLVDGIATRRRTAGDSPELLAALLYGFGDLIERDPVDRTLRQLSPKSIGVQNLATVHQVAASLEPSVRGWTGFLLQLRGLATCTIPDSPTAQANMLLCLSSNAFVNRSCKFSQIVAFARRT